MEETTATLADEHEALIQFLYMAPVGLVEISLDGEIVMINSMSAQLLIPLARNGSISNLFATLESVAPELRHLVAGFGRPHGKVCDGLRIRVGAAEAGKSAPQMLSLTLVKLDEKRLMAVLNDITAQFDLERLLKKNQAWFAAILTGIADYALISLDGQGRVDDWNTGIERLTGFSREAVVGRPYSISYPDGAITPDRLLDQLHRAHEDGGCLYQGWCLKADGNRYWGSAMIVPLREVAHPLIGGAPRPWGTADDAAFGLRLRHDWSARRVCAQDGVH